MIARGRWFIIVTLFLALLLTIFVLPSWLVWIRPCFILLVLVYWALALEFTVGVGIAWVVGLLLDVLNDNFLGEHALALILVIFLVLKFQRQIRVYPVSQQMIVIFALTICYLSVIYWVAGAVGMVPKTAWFWFPAISNALVWPWLFGWLRYVRQKLEIV